MPEGPEVRIMSDFINQFKKKKFRNAFHVEKGNIPKQFISDKEFLIESMSYGKQLQLNLYFTDSENIKIYIFMGMSGNWKWVDTCGWNETRFTRLRLDDDSGKSLLLYGGYMGPKYSIDKPFGGTKRGPDPITDYDNFLDNIIKSNSKELNKPLGEALMNQKYFNGVGAYLNSEILGRLDFDPIMKFSDLSKSEIEKLCTMVHKCMVESYNLGGGELKDWNNPFGSSKIDEWIQFYGNKDLCTRHKFGARNIWILNKWA